MRSHAKASSTGMAAPMKRLIVLLVLANLGFAAFLVSPATALVSRTYEAQVTEASGVPFVNPWGVAVDGSDNLWVSDVGPGLIDKFDPNGAFLAQGNGAGNWTGTNTQGVAFSDASNHAYVADSNLDDLWVLNANASFNAKITGAWGSGCCFIYAAADNSGTATDGAIFVSTSGNFSTPSAIHRLDGAGTPSNFSGSASYIAANQLTGAPEYNGSPEHSFASLQGVAVDQVNGDIYALDAGNNEVDQFESSGVFVRSFTGSFGSISAVAVDPTNGHVLIADTGQGAVHEFDSSGNPLGEITGSGTPAGSFNPQGLTVDSTGKAYVSDGAHAVVDVFGGPIVLPTTVTGSASGLTKTQATLNGTVDPDSVAIIDCHFSYVDGAEFQATGYANATNVPCTPNPGSGSGAVDVSVDLNGLEPDTTYHFRVLAANANGTTQGDDQTFLTRSPPEAESLRASVITESTAVLGGRVNAKGIPSSFYVEYSLSSSLTEAVSVPVGQDSDAGSGSNFIPAAEQVTGLVPNTTYYFRIVAENAEGTSAGQILAFTTLSAPAESGPPRLPDNRAWELVSPGDKNGSGVSRGSVLATIGPPIAHLAQAAGSGEAVAYSTAGSFDGNAAPAFPQYIARRGPSGWVSEGINPRYEPQTGIGAYDNYEWLSGDLNWGLVHTNAALNPDDPLGIDNLYLRNNVQQTFRAVTDADPDLDGEAVFTVQAATPNGSHVVFARSLPFEEGGLLPPELFEWTNGVVREVGILPEETHVRAQVGSGSIHGLASGSYSFGENPISEDGRRIFFTPEIPSRLYVRVDGTTTVEVSKSERAVADGARQPEFQLAAKDGSVAFFTSEQKLTEGSTANGPLSDLYRWEADAPKGERLTDVTVSDPEGPGGVLATVGASDDATSVYFAATGKLTDDAVRGTPNLYLWKQGEGVSLVATVAGNDLSIWSRALAAGGGGIPDDVYRETRVTPDGRYIAFTSRAQLTSYNTNSTKQIYLYDSQSEDLSCVSCGTVEPSSGASSWFASSLTEGECCNATEHLIRNLTPDGGRVFFDSRDALVSADTNGVTDVYEWTNGRLYLLSGGTNGEASRLLDVSESGDDVFFTTAEQLVRADSDALLDLYDARVGGTTDSSPSVPCVADECQGTPSTPLSFATPGSASFAGQPSKTAGSKRRSCAKGKKRANGRCVKKAKHKQSKNRGGRR